MSADAAHRGVRRPPAAASRVPGRRDAGPARRSDAPARAPPARVRDPRRRRRAGRDRDPDGLLVVGDEGLPRSATTRSRSSGRRSSGRRSASSRWSAMMRVDYRWLRVASVPLFVVGDRCPRPRVRPERSTSSRRRVGALAEDRAAAGGPPGRVHEARDGRLPRPLVREARHAGSRASGRDGPVPGDRRRRSSCSSSRSRTSGRRSVLAFTAFTMFFLAGANLVHLAAMAAAAVAGRRRHVHAGLPDRPDPAWLDPWSDPLGDRASTASRASSRSALGGVVGRGPRREPARGRPVPAQRVQRLHLRDHRRGVRPDRARAW